jgi:ATP/maltotriose-dependent transcriptional regulator MalT
LLHSVTLLLTNQLDEAESRLQNAERSIQPGVVADQDQFILGRVATIRGSIVRFAGDLAGCVAFSRQALDLLPETDRIWHPIASVNAARGFLVTGDVTTSNENLITGLTKRASASDGQFAYLSAFINLARLQALQGKLRQSVLTYQKTAQVVPNDRGNDSPDQQPHVLFRFREVLSNGTTGNGRTISATGRERLTGTLTVDADVILLGYLAQARLLRARRDLPGAIGTLEEFKQLAQQRNYFPLLVEIAEEIGPG